MLTREVSTYALVAGTCTLAVCLLYIFFKVVTR